MEALKFQANEFRNYFTMGYHVKVIFKNKKSMNYLKALKLKTNNLI